MYLRSIDLSIHLFLHLFVCVYVYVFLYIDACIHVYICKYTCVNMYIYIYTHTCLHVHLASQTPLAISSWESCIPTVPCLKPRSSQLSILISSWSLGSWHRRQTAGRNFRTSVARKPEAPPSTVANAGVFCERRVTAL